MPGVARHLARISKSGMLCVAALVFQFTPFTYLHRENAHQKRSGFKASSF